ncbi:MAG: TonB-dependent receptor [Nanoarchaeota archaeon]
MKLRNILFPALLAGSLVRPSGAYTGPKEEPQQVAAESTDSKIPAVNLTVTVIEHSKSELDQVPGSVTEVTSEDIQRTRAHNLEDVLAFTPGVFAPSRTGADESQVSIRGSGGRNNFHHRGTNVLFNGVPYGDADGFSDFESWDPSATNRVEVWKGANALRLGGNTMGGAINFVTETGATASPLQLRLGAGSNGLFKGQFSSGNDNGHMGYYISLSDTELGGYRKHSEQGRQRLFSNLVWRPTQKTDTRLDIAYAHVTEELPGALTLQEFKSNPQMADPTNVEQQWGRNYDFAHVAFTVNHRINDQNVVAVTLYGHNREVEHPIFQVLRQSQHTIGADLAYKFNGKKDRFVIGFAPQLGGNTEHRFVNDAGKKGELTGDFRADTTNLGIYAENQWDLTSNFTLVTGARFDSSRRMFEDRFPSEGDSSDARTYQAIQPKVGFVWRVAKKAQVFGNASRSYESPLTLELTSFGAEQGFLPLKAQSAWQFELGTRGQIGEHITLDAAVYRSDWANELLNVNLQPFPGAPFTIPSYVNAPKSRHSGLELGVGVRIAENIAREGDHLGMRAAYTLSDFHFVDHSIFEDNKLPGAPNQVLHAEVRYDSSGFEIAPSVDSVLDSYFLDSPNTVTNKGHTALNVSGEVKFKGFGLFLEGKNLTDARFSGSTQVDVDPNNGRYYEPAPGRSFYAGLHWKK